MGRKRIEMNPSKLVAHEMPSLWYTGYSVSDRNTKTCRKMKKKTYFEQ